ncbi:CdaR family protein [Paenibacillus glycanilyticus]|uniref:CdaA regulatory protein CdaR n=1 Tax=Paenibacillus glycanilyticus TaxID=126569 RepID=A0ABQ6GD74_9BACL|nr:CdaR family protein [Paenibacillus glycanilyticus]GLX68577.1 CdaA regulatory protein CdaR [Paenibacillus glycanilyticus]
MDKWLSHPTILKILSVAIALMLWAMVHFDAESTPATVTSNMDTKVIEAAAVTATGLDETKYALVNVEPTVVRMVVEGRKANLLKINEDEGYAVHLDLSDVTAGEHVVPLTYDLPKGISLIEMSPRSATVDVVEIETKTFELGVATEGTPANGYIAGEPTVKSGTIVNITLPKDEMALVGAVRTTVDIEGAEKTVVNKKAQVVVYDTEGEAMEHAIIKPATVEVEVPVTPPLKTMPLQLSFTGSLPDGLSVSSVKADIDKVAVYGDQKLLDSMDTYTGGVVVDLSKIKESGTVKAKVTAVGDVKMVEPAEINVEVTVVPSETLTLDRSVIMNDLPEGLKAAFKEPADGHISITVRGAPNILAAIQDDDVRLIADLSEAKVGQATFPLLVKLPRFIDLADESQKFSIKLDITDKNASTGNNSDGGGDVPAGGQPEHPPSQTPPPDTGTGTDSGSNNGTNTGTGNGTNTGTDPDSSTEPDPSDSNTSE